jgi:hypothetical protein
MRFVGVFLIVATAAAFAIVVSSLSIQQWHTSHVSRLTNRMTWAPKLF